MEGRESGLHQLLALPALSARWSRGQASTGPQSPCFFSPQDSGPRRNYRVTKPSSFVWFLLLSLEASAEHSVVRAKGGARLRRTTGQPHCLQCLPQWWVCASPGMGSPPFDWCIGGIRMPEGGVLPGQVQTGRLAPRCPGPDCDLPAVGTQILPEAFPHVGLSGAAGCLGAASC